MNKIFLKLIGLAITLTCLSWFVFGGHLDQAIAGFKEGSGIQHIDPSSQQLTEVFYTHVLLKNKHEQPSQQELTLKDQHVIQYQQNYGQYTLISRTDIPNLPFYFYFVLLVEFIVFGILVLNMILFIQKLINGEIFHQTTYTSLLYIGLTLILFPIADYLMMYIQWKAINELFIQTTFEVIKDFSFHFSWTVGGFMVLAMVMAMKLGIKIKEENDLTI